MNGQHLENSEPKLKYMEINQLVEDARKLRAKTISEAAISMKNRLRSFLTQWSDGSFGTYQLKKNKKIRV